MNEMTALYDLAITSYALSKAGSSLGAVAFSKLDKFAVLKGKFTLVHQNQMKFSITNLCIVLFFCFVFVFLPCHLNEFKRNKLVYVTFRVIRFIQLSYCHMAMCRLI